MRESRLTCHLPRAVPWRAIPLWHFVNEPRRLSDRASVMDTCGRLASREAPPMPVMTGVAFAISADEVVQTYVLKPPWIGVLYNMKLLLC
jgi:hypothetical protein